MQKRLNLNALLRLSLTMAGQQLFGQSLDVRTISMYASCLGQAFMQMVNMRK
ncbi:MAG: hypothetical protein R2820_06650 [Cyclobacteriaceae bacterium]